MAALAPAPAPAADPPEMDGVVYSRSNVFNHPRPRTKRQWRDEVESVRVEARVTLDAFVSGRLADTPELAGRLSWLVRIAVEYRKMLVVDKIRLGSRFSRAWDFRTSARRRTKRDVHGDVFCLFCHQPLAINQPRYSRLHYPRELDYGTRRDLSAHTTKCALLFLAGMIEGAPWGSVAFADPDAPL